MSVEERETERNVSDAEAIAAAIDQRFSKGSLASFLAKVLREERARERVRRNIATQNPTKH